ncbi:unnamed protein product [Nesidiocoris tenuis]|uniref:Uncharacterized protein n=1 Tax=Nesidiocoris tenuis TaxID=355587 RepID=A0A6H5GRD8_9HEMI|nr:unnamed protein product [Nesidiocoris tenuis]
MPQECLRTIVKACLALMLPSATGLVLEKHVCVVSYSKYRLPCNERTETDGTQLSKMQLHRK